MFSRVLLSNQVIMCSLDHTDIFCSGRYFLGGFREPVAHDTTPSAGMFRDSFNARLVLLGTGVLSRGWMYSGLKFIENVDMLISN